jgi:catechol 2,3-dioxygenase-like lactoylglutathione lyase family enzyme
MVGFTSTVNRMSAGKLTPSSFRVARPVSQIPASLRFYVDILGRERLGGFAGHDGYDGVFVGRPGSDWHIEFTSHESGMPAPTPTEEDLLVFYVSEDQLQATVSSLVQAGIRLIRHENPYWAKVGSVACRDPDGYLVILCPQSGGSSYAENPHERVTSPKSSSGAH